MALFSMMVTADIGRLLGCGEEAFPSRKMRASQVAAVCWHQVGEASSIKFVWFCGLSRFQKRIGICVKDRAQASI